MKKILIIICILFLTGCTIESNVTVNLDGTIKEEVSILDDNAIFKSEVYSMDKMIEFNINQYRNVLNFRNYDYDIIKRNKKSGAKFYNDFDNICSYFSNTVFNQYVYKHIKCNETDEHYEIYNDTDYIPYCSNCSDWPSLDDITFKIQFPVKPVETNADEIKDLTYIWKYDKTTRNKKIYIKLSKKDIEQEKLEIKVKNERKNNIKKIGIIAFTIILIGCIIFIGYNLYKKYKENKMEY